ncbi:hypothetical protein D7X55_04100 [Corallococcus sp. AB049A]|uniref:Uncharacterized protein n=1 Tax=Corallococcus interemptor TaxID=2316720 RepID=A0A3A8QSH3_9BACT|nr:MULTISPECIES: hypothetical protein [Corallococcus]RKH51373.1 hypothetical protein D7Y23_10245 [Corallococcus sp. AB050B]RKH71729.1 hypothetical protein D7X96_07315 [Corallococcus interemptor]RKI73840.1 hypothetical protein D7X55_04100 [Corallococcus sp. AB049A]
MMADDLMHNPMNGLPRFRRAPFALVLSLTVLGGTGCGREPGGVTGHMRVRHGEVWEEFPTSAFSQVQPQEARDSGFNLGPVFSFCNSDDLSEKRQENSRGLCVYVDVELFAKGSGPAEYAIDGAAHVPGLRYRGTHDGVYFEPGPGHSPGLKAAWTQSFCAAGDDEKTAIQQVSGRFVLEENSEDRLRGHLELTVQGPTAGTCPGEAAEVALDFDFRD